MVLLCCGTLQGWVFTARTYLGYHTYPSPLPTIFLVIYYYYIYIFLKKKLYFCDLLICEIEMKNTLLRAGTSAALGVVVAFAAFWIIKRKLKKRKIKKMGGSASTG